MSESMSDFFFYERQLQAEGFSTVCGVDEAGAGPLAGPVFAAAVILPASYNLPGLDDSKKLTEKKREALFPLICEQAIAFSIASVSAAEIDRVDILNARILAMQHAIDGLSVPADIAIIDGNRDHGSLYAIQCEHRTLIKGDSLSASVAAASVLAKVSRDRFVVEHLHADWPQYAFDAHKGYGTKLHYERLDEFGPCPEHRITFLKKWKQKHGS